VRHNNSKVVAFALVMFTFCSNLNAQVKTNFNKSEKENTSKKNRKVNAIGISIPIIWNNSEATFYRLGRPYYPSGKAKSSGLKISYCKSLYKRIYAKIGAGYFNQYFNIIRPFNYDSPFQLLFSTESYSYNCLQLFTGLGYQKKLGLKNLIKCELGYNYFSSFKQKYFNTPTAISSNQINHKSIPLGRMITLNIGIEKKIFRHFYLGADFILPVSTRWKKDEIFINSYYSNDEEQIARNKFSAGIAFSCNYHF
jgi:hypothetical protein